MAILKVVSHRLLCCVPTLYVYMSKCYFINIKSKHKERLIFDGCSLHLFTEPVMKFMEGFKYQKLIQKLKFYIDCVGKCKYKY